MGKRRTAWNHKTYLRFLNEGRGRGNLADYKPWITTHDFPSRGKVVRMLGKKTKRIHHLLSQLEKTFFVILDNDPDVEDIKEQYPLPLYETQLIAARLGIKHPEISGFSYVMTTDFVYSKKGTWHAVQIKPSKYLEDERVQEKFLIEKEYYRQIGIDWCVLTEKDLSTVMAANYLWLGAGERIDVLIPSPDTRRLLEDVFLEMYQDITIPFRIMITVLEEEFDLIPGTAMQLFKSLVLAGRISVDLSRCINTAEPRQHLYGL